ncbi:MAG: FtsW/RodA/SpoVE family cell cycle protein, partial [Bdellovibrionales bacterium]
MRLDRGILLAVLFLVGLGLVQVYSSSYIFATEMHGDGLFFFRKQVLFAILGLIAMFAVSLMPWEWSERTGRLLWVVSVIGIAGTFIPGVGMRIGGAHRWLMLPMGFRFEPGELLRVTYPFMLAPLIADYARGNIDGAWFKRFFLTIAPLAVLYKQPDF